MNEYHIGNNALIFKFDKNNEPALKCDLPAKLVFDTEDCFSGQIKYETDTMDHLDYSVMNPATGPVYFNGVSPGDVLEIKINRIDCKSPGVTICIPNEGNIRDLVKKSVTRIYQFENNVVDMGGALQIEMEPMIGVIGIAPADETPMTMESGDFGGNMDCKLIKEGATLFLPVQVEGALFGLGDVHATQGDGEAFYTALEVAAQVEVEVKVRKDLKMTIPFVVADGKFASIATADSTDKALHDAMAYLLEFIENNGDLDFYDAGFILGLFGDLEVSQVVDDPLRTMRMSLKLDILEKTGVKLFP